MYVAVAVIVFIVCCMCAENLKKILVQLRLNMGTVLTTPSQRIVAEPGLLLVKEVIPILLSLTSEHIAILLSAAGSATLLAMSAVQRNEYLAKLGAEFLSVAIGATIGMSVCPVVGTAIGAGIGGLSGFLLAELTKNHTIAHKEDQKC